jgi:hypothetical protein
LIAAAAVGKALILRWQQEEPVAKTASRRYIRGTGHLGLPYNDRPPQE